MMTESLAEGRNEAAHILRLCLRQAEHIDPSDNLVAGVLRQSIGRILARGFLNDPRVQEMAGTTPQEVEALLTRLADIERGGDAGKA